MRSSKRSTSTGSHSQSHALRRAKQIERTLSNEFPRFIKIMRTSHVSRGRYWLTLPKSLRGVHLPQSNNIVIVLEDENGREYEAQYIAKKVYLSAGWKKFSTAHNLVEGDVLVFHLIQPSKFKVYIAKSHGSNELEVAHSLLRLDGSSNQHNSTDVLQENDSSSNRMICDARMPPLDQPDNTCDLEENLSLGGSNRNRLGRSITITFQESTSIENFSVVVNGLVLDSQLPQQLRTKYYELCNSQNMFLHEHLLGGGQNSQLVIGMIHEIINIADAIKASKITTPLSNFELWYRKLKGLEMWGMNVSFLLARLEQLMRLASKTEEYREARNHRERAEEEKISLELKLEKVRETIRKLDDEIDSLSLNLKTFDVEFQGLASAPW